MGVERPKEVTFRIECSLSVCDSGMNVSFVHDAVNQVIFAFKKFASSTAKWGASLRGILIEVSGDLC